MSAACGATAPSIHLARRKSSAEKGTRAEIASTNELTRRSLVRRPQEEQGFQVLLALARGANATPGCA